jgi:hypothetical protein
MKISSTSLVGEKSGGFVQNLALLPKNLILLAEAGELPMRTIEQIGLLRLGSPPA